jgi:hypothetical protein
MNPMGTSGGIPADCASIADQEFMRVHVDTTTNYAWGLVTDHGTIDMVLTSAPGECVHGSRLTPLKVLNNTPVTDGLEGLGVLILTAGFINGSADGKIVVHHLPTYIPSTSSLLWQPYNYAPSVAWNDYSWSSTDNDHDVRMSDANNAGMVLGWISEYSKGEHDRPVWTSSKSAFNTRAAVAETINGMDDDGDEKVDELEPYEGGGLTAAWHDRNNNTLTVVSQNRYWNYNWSTGWTQTGYLDNGYILNGTLLFDPKTMPRVNGMLPWEGPGITAAWDSQDGTRLLIVSGNRFWVWDWAGSYWWTWGTIGSYNTGIAGIFPNFGAAPTVNGEYPWTGNGITGSWHRIGTRYLTMYRDYRYWTYDLQTSSWWDWGTTNVYSTGAQWQYPSDGSRVAVQKGSSYYNFYNASDAWTGYGYLSNDAFWQQAPAPQPTIVVQSATYGGNCGAATNNQLNTLWANCDGRQSCLYMVDYQRIGDPVPGCSKDYSVTYRCSTTSAQKSVYLYAEAGNGSIASLSCP